MERPFTLVFDIGKTAKKVLVFDDEFNVLAESTEYFSEIMDDDNFPGEDLPAISQWVVEEIAAFTNRYPQIAAINFSGYGASLVHLDDKEEVITPFYNYLKPLPDDCLTVFLKRHNDQNDICTTTASPLLGMLNSGLQLFWLKKNKPKHFARIKTTLHLPQYFSFLISGKKFTDVTSLGCHTILWDFEKKRYHRWVQREKMTELFAPVHLPDHSFYHEIEKKKRKIGIGVHDSSAALMPYLVSMTERFLLLSTGTWNITFNPFNHELLTRAELAKDCLCYLTCQGNPVKASRIFLGHEHELQVRAIASHFNVSPEAFRDIPFEEELYEMWRDESSRNQLIFSIGMEGTGPIPERETRKTDWTKVNAHTEAYHAMILQLVRWQIMSIELINPNRHVKNLIVVGGFARNKIFLEILKREVSHIQVFLSDHPHASALGAAWLVNDPILFKGQKSLLNIVSA